MTELEQQDEQHAKSFYERSRTGLGSHPAIVRAVRLAGGTS